MDYNKEMQDRLRKYRQVHATNPRKAAVKMLIWNIYFMFKGSGKKKNAVSGKYITDSGKLDIQKIKREFSGIVDKNFYKQTDNLIELQSELLESNKEKIEKQIRDSLKAEITKRRVDVVFITDDNYAMPTAVAVSSLYYNANENTDYHVYVLGVELSEHLAEIIRKSGNNVEVITLGNEFSQFNFWHEHVSKAALYKFKICDILKDLPKVLYLDSDMLFQKDLADFYYTDLGECYAAVVKDLHVMKQKYKGIAKMGLTDYFNSGMMLLNLEKMRKEKLSDRLLEVKKELNRDSSFTFMDQDTFNKTFNGNVIFASVNYNFLNVYYQDFEKVDLASICDLPIDEVYEIYDKPAILHIGGKDRPWKSILGEKSLLYNKYMIINKIFRKIISEERG